MSLSINGVWKAGVWDETVWVDGVWREGEYVPAPVTAVRGGGVDHQRKRKKSTLADRPIEHLNKIIDESFSDIKAAKEAFKELTGKKSSKNVKKQANKLVAEYSEAYRPKVNQIDWVAFANDLEAANLLFKLYQKEIADKRLFDIIENDNVEFLLMH